MSQLNEEKLVALLRKKGQQFLENKNVTSVGVGFKVKDGKRTDQLCIQYTVEKKLSLEGLEAAGIEKLPSSLTDDDGNEIPIDVVERRYETSVKIVEETEQLTDPQKRRKFQDPVFPGISISHIEGTAGTLGAIVYDRQSGSPLVLSNWHVLHGPTGRIGDDIVQPGPFDGGGAPRTKIGELLRSHLGLAGDCAVCSIEGRGVETKVAELNVIPRRMGKVNLGDKVVKSGRTTGVTHGIVARVGVVVKLNYGGSAGERQIGGFEIRPNPDKPAAQGEISSGGDSGSVWLMDDDTHKDVVVGLHFAGESDPDPNEEHALACNIHSVVDKLDVSLRRRRRPVQALRAARPAEAGEEPAQEALLDESNLDELQKQFERDPRGLLEAMRRVVDNDLSEEALAYALEEARNALDRPEQAVRQVEALSAERVASDPLPENFRFPGIDLERIPINWRSKKFEPVGDLLGWMLFAGGPIAAGFEKAPFAYPSNSGFKYPLQEPSPEHPLEIALFADWGTGLYHSRYIARQFQQHAFPYAVHLGDVYYAGRPSEFDEYVKQILAPVLPRTEMFFCNSNHEMYTGGQSYFRFLAGKRAADPARQRQEGSLFALQTARFQLIGLDTAYFQDGRFRQQRLLEWLDLRLAEGRSNGQVNILLSANEPYEYGKPGLRELFTEDLRSVMGERVDLWFWGNTHYCALFDRAQQTPFLGSCIGHGGFPYKRLRLGDQTPAPLAFLETAARFPEWTGLRQNRGNNGYCVLTLRSDGTVNLSYRDWMSNVRCMAELTPGGPGGALRLSHVQPRPVSEVR